MWKAVLAGTTALAIAGTSLVYAQKSSDDFQRTQRWRPGAADIAAFGDARIAALHAGLKLTAEQEKLWPPVEAALRDLAKQRWSASRREPMPRVRKIRLNGLTYEPM